MACSMLMARLSTPSLCSSRFKVQGSNRGRALNLELQTVNGRILASYVADPCPGADRLASDALHQLVGRELAAMPVQLLLQPAQEAAELSPGDLTVQSLP